MSSRTVTSKHKLTPMGRLETAACWLKDKWHCTQTYNQSEVHVVHNDEVGDNIVNVNMYTRVTVEKPIWLESLA